MPQASKLAEVDENLKAILTDEKLREIVNLIPTEWLYWDDVDLCQEEIKEVYFQFLTKRKAHSLTFIKEAEDARKLLL